MPPYKPVVSKSQARALFAKADRGEISKADARGKTRAADYLRLPERVPLRKRPIAAKRINRRTPSRSR